MLSLRFLVLLSCMALAPSVAQARVHHRHASSGSSGAKPVILTQQPNSALDQAARQLNQGDISAATAKGDRPIVLVGSAPLAASGHGDIALFVQIQSARLCGSAGCSTSIYLGHRDHWTKILDSVSGTISVLPRIHGGMHDLLVGKDDRWAWDGHEYQDTMPAPPIGNLRADVAAHQAGHQ